MICELYFNEAVIKKYLKMRGRTDIKKFIGKIYKWKS